MFRAFPKIHALGTRFIQNIFDGEVEVTEKIDGSQFKFGRTSEGELLLGSRNGMLYREVHDKLFAPAVSTVLSVECRLMPGYVYYGETLAKPKHNVLNYARVPQGNIALFGIYDAETDMYLNHDLVLAEAARLGLEVVTVFPGLNSVDSLLEALPRTTSQLGGVCVEGFVVKNYCKPYMIGGIVVPFMAGKYVSESFKEVHRNKAYGKSERKSDLQSLLDSYCTETRWQKAVQHVAEAGKLDRSPSDIGGLIKEVQNDIVNEERENIKEELYKLFHKDLMRAATRGLPEWYKDKLARGHV